ncbi:MAG: lytic transglycosylase domain-containing protein [Gammaproteobacteria bacterium]|nr:lytic transglycosylase domain-containing protein [Gammaproteobacteria bacterium]
MIDQPSIPNNYPAFQPISEQCITQTSERFSLPDIILKAILKVEGGHPGELRINTNGTYDIGPMQVNSIWLPKFSNYVTAEQIYYDGCANLQVGAWILRYNINKAKGNIWQGIGSYHSSTPVHQDKYRAKIYAAMQKLNTKTT